MADEGFTFCTTALVSLLGYSRDKLVTLLRAFPENEKTKQSLENIAFALEHSYAADEKVTDLKAAVDFLYKNGYEEEGDVLFDAASRRADQPYGFYMRLR